MGKAYAPLPPETERLAKEVVDAAFKIHRTLGPGLLESAYEICMCREFSLRGIAFEKQKAMPVEYEGLRLDAGYRLDLLVGGVVLVELKSVEKLLPIHQAQALTYMKLARLRLCLLINFKVPVMKEGIKRIVI